MPIGELATKAMGDLVREGAAPVYRIGNLEDISVSRNDLMSLDGTVRFANIETLTFEDDVDWEVFKDRVESVENVETVLLPKGLSKFQVLTRARNVEDIRVK
jgi:hypothetical protein